MGEVARSLALGTLGLWALLLVAVAVGLTRPPPAAGDRRLAAAGILAIALQAGHFTEELTQQFHVRFPELLGLAPWPEGLFVAFNLAWLVLWAGALTRLGENPRLAAALLWFLALGSIANGVAHPLMSAAVGGYFPGLLTSPLVGLAGLHLARCLSRASRGGLAGPA